MRLIKYLHFIQDFSRIGACAAAAPPPSRSYQFGRFSFLKVVRRFSGQASRVTQHLKQFRLRNVINRSNCFGDSRGTGFPNRWYRKDLTLVVARDRGDHSSFDDAVKQTAFQPLIFFIWMANDCFAAFDVVEGLDKPVHFCRLAFVHG